jgi:D-sedoheptulose 7-phosphate isomerase
MSDARGQRSNLYLPDWYPTDSALLDSVERAGEVLVSAFQGGHSLLMCGNGGSAADCDHIAGELLKSFRTPRPLPSTASSALERCVVDGRAFPVDAVESGLPAISLTSHAAAISAILNDLDPDVVYAQLVIALGRPGDILLAISTSGNSWNVVWAAAAARARGITVIGLTGSDGGRLRETSDVLVAVPARETARVQELHVATYHAWCDFTEKRMFR